MLVKNFEDLEIWKEARRLTQVYVAVDQSYVAQKNLRRSKQVFQTSIDHDQQPD